MRILYAIQGTGNGHISRAKEIIPALMNRVLVDVLVSGDNSEVDLPFPIKYRFKGISFVFGKNGGIDYYRTLKKNNLFRILNEIRKCKVKDYDLIINDFEPISAWASYLRSTANCTALSHQYSILINNTPKPKRRNWIGDFILRHYAPSTIGYGIHFKPYNKNIFPAIIRKDIRKQKISSKKYYVVYLPSYSDEKIIAVLTKLKKIRWKVYSKHTEIAYKIKNIQIQPICNKTFERSLARCQGVICGAGFETPAEVLYLKKKLLVIPMKGQYEQACNAESLKYLGVPVLNKLSFGKIKQIKKWVETDQTINISFPDKTQFIIDEILSNHIIATELSNRLFQNI